MFSDENFLPLIDPVTYYTALHIAVLRNQPDMVELLVQRGADINRRDRVCSQPNLVCVCLCVCLKTGFSDDSVVWQFQSMQACPRRWDRKMGVPVLSVNTPPFMSMEDKTRNRVGVGPPEPRLRWGDKRKGKGWYMAATPCNFCPWNNSAKSAKSLVQMGCFCMGT